jgi:hypothetical protein
MPRAASCTPRERASRSSLGTTRTETHQDQQQGSARPVLARRDPLVTRAGRSWRYPATSTTPQVNDPGPLYLPLYGREVVGHGRTLTGTEVTHTAVVLALRRAKEAGEAEEAEATHPDGDRCAHWRAV